MGLLRILLLNNACASSVPSSAERPVIELEGKDKDFAFNKIEEYGLSLGEIVYVYSNKYPKDKIVCANFSTAMSCGYKVNVVISKGNEPSKFPYQQGNISVVKSTEEEIPYYHISEWMNTEESPRQSTRYTLEGE